MQIPLLRSVAPPVPGWCDLRLGDVGPGLAALAAEGVRVDLVIADPPWAYDHGQTGAAADHYACLPFQTIRDHIESARRIAAVGSRCLLWTTGAMLPGLTARCLSTVSDGAVLLCGWRWVTSGSWVKLGDADDEGKRRGPPGMGYHARSSQSEPWLVLAGPGPHARADVPGCWVAPTAGHSAKPVMLQAEMIRGWCPPGGVVLDLYAGLGSVARAVHRAGGERRYIGFEIDPERREGALSLLAQEVGR